MTVVPSSVVHVDLKRRRALQRGTKRTVNSAHSPWSVPTSGRSYLSAGQVLRATTNDGEEHKHECVRRTVTDLQCSNRGQSQVGTKDYTVITHHPYAEHTGVAALLRKEQHGAQLIGGE